MYLITTIHLTCLKYITIFNSQKGGKMILIDLYGKISFSWLPSALGSEIRVS